ncbi:hypothetical protein TKK_0006762 [Trichogramma kaykai]|uniref:Acylamino-acid-releasing enzyme n=1 Tax=Trichogramma kaykai TaxID=54128 RepID=A0ABD2XDG3_9HYME
MSSTKVNEIIKVYKKLAQTPNLASAKIVFNPNNITTIESQWSSRNLETKKKNKFSQSFFFNEMTPIAKTFPADTTSELMSVSSSDDSIRAILREISIDAKSKQFVEIWDKQQLLKSFDLAAMDVHGDVYTTPTFASFHWSPDNTRLLYLAEKKLPKSESFFTRKAKKNKDQSSEDSIVPGNEYVYKPEWGEQLVGKHRSVVAILNIEEETLTAVEDIPEEYFPSQVCWAPNGEDIVGIVYKLHHRYLGLMFCTNRESYVFHLKKNDFRLLTGKDISVRAPRFSPDGKYLVWLERDMGPAHHDVQRLMYMEWEQQVPQVLIDVVDTHITIANKSKFYGVYNQNFPKRCWSEDSKFLFFTTPQRNTFKSYSVNLETKEIREFDGMSDDVSYGILDVKGKYISLVATSLTLPSQLLLGKYEYNCQNELLVHLQECTKPALDSVLTKDIILDINEYTYKNEDSVKDFNYIYLGKKNAPDKSVPLIVVPHGGPNSNFSNDFIVSHMFYATLGFGILQINYRGSTGMGGKNVDYILGKIGSSDIEDTITAIDEALQKYPWLDPKNIFLNGGSHGGFMIAHLTGQYPDKFRAAALRNPVIDLPSMFSSSDIPDWCSSQSGIKDVDVSDNGDFKKKQEEMMFKMLSHSPILLAHKVKTPTLVAIGSNDLRVPPHQGKLWFNRLRENNTKARLYVYDDNHSLSKDEVDMDFVINCIMWFIDHQSS